MLALRSKNDDIKHVESLAHFNPGEWLYKRPSDLVNLLANIFDMDINTAGDKKRKIIVKIVELISYCRNSKLVLPNHFLENLLCYSFTNSKSYANFLGSRAPGGSYSYITSWLTREATNPIKCPSGIVKAIFDNNQKVGKTM